MVCLLCSTVKQWPFCSVDEPFVICVIHCRFIPLVLICVLAVLHGKHLPIFIPYLWLFKTHFVVVSALLRSHVICIFLKLCGHVSCIAQYCFNGCIPSSLLVAYDTSELKEGDVLDVLSLGIHWSKEEWNLVSDCPVCWQKEHPVVPITLHQVYQSINNPWFACKIACKPVFVSAYCWRSVFAAVTDNLTSG